MELDGISTPVLEHLLELLEAPGEQLYQAASKY